MIPSYSNFGGKVHGGHILSLMDKTAYVCASKHAGAYCVTASIDTVDFLESVDVGDLVTLYASVNYVGNSSMIIGMRVESENIRTQVVKHTNTSYFSMVAIDDQHKPVQVSGLILRSHTEVRRFFEAFHRKELKKYYRKEQDRIKSEFEKNEWLEILKKERVIIDFDL